MLCFSFKNVAIFEFLPLFVSSKIIISEQDNCGVLKLPDTFLGNSPVFLYPSSSDSDEHDFLALPDEAQKFLLKKGSDSDEELHRQLETFKLKE